MNKIQLLTTAICTLYLLFAACSKKQATEIRPDTTTAPGQPGAVVVVYADVQNLFQTRCSGCHSSGRQASSVWNFNGYTSITTNADRIKQAVLINKSMPIGGSLSAAELKTLQDWFDQGMKP